MMSKPSLICLAAVGISIGAYASSGQQYAYLPQITEQIDWRLSQAIYTSIREELVPCSTHEAEEFFLWTNGGFGESWANKGYHGYNCEGTIGAHARSGPHFLLGVAGYYSWDKLHFHQGGKNGFNTFEGALYFAYNAPRAYFLANLGAGKTTSSFSRPVHSRHAHSRLRLSHGLLYSEFGYNAFHCAFLVQPFIGIEGDYLYSPSFNEHQAGSYDLYVGKLSEWRGNGYAGTHLRGKLASWLTLNLDAAWRYHLGPQKEHVHTLMRSTGERFTARTSEQGQNGVIGALELSFALSKVFHLSCTGSGEWWKNYHAYQTMATLSAKW
ncbi:MAG: autotransporter outer membrane beta-barrel domain-containing protein [Verrucomicrobia bacterium]|nr:autotransporter outer membrane beta-barrel domain-containing protein [Verrucomicrobiota bacterium]